MINKKAKVNLNRCICLYTMQEYSGKIATAGNVSNEDPDSILSAAKQQCTLIYTAKHSQNNKFLCRTFHRKRQKRECTTPIIGEYIPKVKTSWFYRIVELIQFTRTSRMNITLAHPLWWFVLVPIQRGTNPIQNDSGMSRRTREIVICHAQS